MVRRVGDVLNTGGVSSGRGRVNTKLCRNGRTCEITGCDFRHEPINKACKFGATCTRKDTCLFSHGTQQDVLVMGSNINQIPRNNQVGIAPKNVRGRV